MGHQQWDFEKKLPRAHNQETQKYFSSLGEREMGCARVRFPGIEAQCSTWLTVFSLLRPLSLICSWAYHLLKTLNIFFVLQNCMWLPVSDRFTCCCKM